jgi:AcrR family transcriptional regulator
MARIQTDKDKSRKEIILRAAAHLFHKKGYKSASMRDLASQVGVEAASLYNHIKSKTELLHDICFDTANLYWEHLHEVEKSKASPIEKIEKLIRFHIRQIIEHYEEVYVTDREWKHLEEPYLTNYRNQRRDYRKSLAAIIQEGIDTGYVQFIDASTAVLIILHAITGVESWHRSYQKIDATELENNMVTIFINGLKK